MEGKSNPETVFENAYAVIVGLNAYEDPEIRTLAYADADARAFCQFLVEKIGFSSDNIRLLINEEATKRNIERAISNWLPKKVDEKSLVIFFFTGHGGLETDRTGIEKDGVAKYLLPYDAKHDDLFSSAISNRRFAELLAAIKSGKMIPPDKMVILLDACYAGALSESGKAISPLHIKEDPYEQIMGGAGRFVIAACQPDQRSYEDSRIEHGIFTHHLLKGLSGEADYDKDGYVYNTELFRYLGSEVPRSAKELLGEIQEPLMKSSITRDFALSFNPARLREIALEEKKEHLYAFKSDKKLSPGEYDEAFRILTASPETLSEKDRELHGLVEELLSGEISVETYRETRRILAEKYGETYEEAKILEPPLKKDIEIKRKEEEEEIERLRQEADAYMKEKRYQDAEVVINAILKINPADSQAKRLLGEIGEIRRAPGEPPEKPPTKPPVKKGKKFPIGIAIGIIAVILIAAILLIIPPPPPEIPVINYFEASPSKISAGDSTTLRWSVSGATRVTLETSVPIYPVRSVELIGEIVESPTETITYTLEACNEVGCHVAPVKVIVEEEALPINNPPDPIIESINPSPALQGQSVTFECHGEDPDSGDSITEYRWESSIDGFLSDKRTFSTSSLTSGLHEISLRVKDSRGRWSSERTRNLKVKIYLHEDFENGMPENWWLWVDPEQKESTFFDVIVEPGTSNHVLRGHGDVHTGPNFGQEWEDYSLQVRIMLLKGQSSHLVVRSFWESEENNGRYFIKVGSNKIEICKTINKVHYNNLARVDKYLGYDTWHIVKVICKGDQIKVYVDGEFVTEYIVDDPLKSGRISLETQESAEDYYDDILVEEVE